MVKGFHAKIFKKGEEKMNVLAGSYFKEYFQVGDTINNRYTIIGFTRK